MARQPVFTILFALGLLLVASCSAPAPRWGAIAGPDNSLEFAFVRDGKPAFTIGLGGWGPSWQWVDVSSNARAAGDRYEATVPFVVDQGAGKVVTIGVEVWRSAFRQITFRYRLTADRDVPVTMVIASLNVPNPPAGSRLTLRPEGGTPVEVAVPFGRSSHPAISSAMLALGAAGEAGVTMTPPCPVNFDGDMRIMLAQDVVKRGEHVTTIAVDLPEDVDLLASQADIQRLTRNLAGPDWFPFEPTGDLGDSVIGMSDWLDKPAGKHGGVRMVGDRFQLEDGTPVKLWGVDLSYGDGCAPVKASAAYTAARFAKYGINAVRLHKFSYPTDQMGIGDPNDATRMTPEGMDRLDYFASQLAQNGVYYGWSHTFGFHVCPGNRDRLVAYDEIARNLKGNTYALINFADDVQDLMIEMVVNLLKHKNPYTGHTYATDPALSFVELQNEDDIFFYTSTDAFNACPTYKKLFTTRFCDWLVKKYGTEAALRKAWAGAIEPSESLAGHNIAPQVNPWFFGADHLPGQKGGARQRLLDSATWLHELQNRFYSRFVKAIRATGYKGPICGSPWQAPAMLPHYLNLQSDYAAGYIDRHNYFGGGIYDTMLGHPGSGYLSSGMQQVADRPFGLSEWITVFPSLYSAEGPAIVAAYGMGLQGWDASYEFQSSSARHAFADRAGWMPWGVWEADVPTQVGQYPAIARMIYRGDVREGPVISTRYVHPENLASGVFDFTDTVEQKGDVKSFGGGVPAEALAVGRVVVQFADGKAPSTFPDLSKARQGDALVSNTGQLAWHTGGKGYLTINTPGTRAVVGFAEGKAISLGGVTFQSASPYTSIFLTALEKGVNLSNTKAALLTVVARNCNTGFTYYAVDNRMLDGGKAPILLEPVKASVTIASRKVAAINILDHDGRRTGRTVPVTGGRFEIDGVRDHAIYYEVVFR